MLKIRFGVIEPLVRSIDGFFDIGFEREWLDNEFVRRIIKDVDKSEVRNGTDIESPILGAISPLELSGGSKLIIQTLFEPEYNYTGSAAGDNCNKWFLEIGKLHDITLCYYHLPDYREPLEILVLNSGKIVRTKGELISEYLDNQEEMYREWDVYGSSKDE